MESGNARKGIGPLAKRGIRVSKSSKRILVPVGIPSHSLTQHSFPNSSNSAHRSNLDFCWKLGKGRIRRLENLKHFCKTQFG